MKKSSVLMYAYVFVLLSVVVLDHFIKDNITSRIAIAAAAASYFFSFAEMNELTAKRTEASLSLNKLVESSMGNNIVRIEAYIKKNRDRFEALEHRLENYKSYSEAESIFNSIQRAYRTLENMDELAQNMKESKSELRPQTEQWERRRKRRIILSRVFLFLGFFLFFIIALFDSISVRLASSQDAISISAFAMIVFCYEFKDQSDEDNKTLQEKKRQSDEIVNKVLELTNDDFDTDLLNAEIELLIAKHSPLFETK